MTELNDKRKSNHLINELSDDTDYLRGSKFRAINNSINDLKFRIDVLHTMTKQKDAIDVNTMTNQSFLNMTEQLDDIDCILYYLESEFNLMIVKSN